MYIWIMLATIMIALSFFNLSPRPDKEDTFVKVKATSVATRFRIEHNAFIRVADCKIKNATSSVDVTGMVLSNTISGSETSVTCQGYGSDTDCAMFENNLPIGYQKGADLNTYHYVYCLNGNLLEGGNPISAACTSSDATHRYAISVARVPNRWMSKGAADQSPLPVL
ncbi:MAG: hypothetical protein IKO06_03525, partial [Alphaproteobacteria bacterium]|nr:hypothetical protein [Alphaproteobacteria bacterium]